MHQTEQPTVPPTTPEYWIPRLGDSSYRRDFQGTTAVLDHFHASENGCTRTKRIKIIYYSCLLRTIRLHTKVSFSPVTLRQDWRISNKRCSPVSVVRKVAQLIFIIENQNQILGKLNSPKDRQFRAKRQKNNNKFTTLIFLKRIHLP
jgi:hypothetical protein